MDSGNLSTLVGAICGFGASVTPEIIGVYKDAKTHEYTMDEKRLELEAADKNYTFQLQNQTILSSTEELKALLKHDATLSGNAVIDGLRASVRPVITYIFMSLFCLMKVSFVVYMMQHDVSFVEVVPLLWDADTMSIFAAVLSFWFGSRAMESYRQNNSRSLNTGVRKAQSQTRLRRRAPRRI
tara:strand:+ start:1310 stop:1858 length:549 start_codon:yes stop_codon:yes gene_type:complete